jgi:hypothetical protein
MTVQIDHALTLIPYSKAIIMPAIIAMIFQIKGLTTTLMSKFKQSIYSLVCTRASRGVVRPNHQHQSINQFAQNLCIFTVGWEGYQSNKNQIDLLQSQLSTSV